MFLGRDWEQRELAIARRERLGYLIAHPDDIQARIRYERDFSGGSDWFVAAPSPISDRASSVIAEVKSLISVTRVSAMRRLDNRETYRDQLQRIDQLNRKEPQMAMHHVWQEVWGTECQQRTAER